MTQDQTALLKAIMARLDRIERLVATYSLDQGRTLTLMKDGFRMVVDAGSIDLGQWLIRNGEWESGYTAAFKKLLRPDDMVVDVGANQGWYTLVAANEIKRNGWAKSAAVAAIEPNQALCDMIRTSIFANGFQSIAKVMNLAVSDRKETLFLATLDFMKGSSTTRRHSGALRRQGDVVETETQAMPLDLLVAEGQIRMPTLIKADVEGWEGVMLNGAATILRDSPGLRMMLEWSSQMDATPFNRKTSAERLAGLGFRAFLVEGQTGLREADWSEINATPTLLNIYLAREDLAAVVKG